MSMAMRIHPMQTRTLGKAVPVPMQSTTIPGAVAASQLGDIDISSMMNLMITMMIVVMMMKMMTGAMGSVAK